MLNYIKYIQFNILNEFLLHIEYNINFDTNMVNLHIYS